MAFHLDVSLCEYCGEPLPPRCSTGRRRRFCCNAHRDAAGRARRSTFAIPPDLTDLALDPHEPVEAFLVGQSSSTDDQVFAVLRELLLLTVTCRRLASQCRSQFAWRCAGMADALDAALSRYFKGLGQ